jgi:N-acetyl sugar amidotransferase
MICKRCVSDNTLPDIVFDEQGECNYCKQFDAIVEDSPNDQEGMQYLNNLISSIKNQKPKTKYDVLIGVSGGVDSTYLVHYAIQHGLKVLAVNFDNGWHSEIAVNNIKKSLQKLNIDLVTYVVDYDEMRDILLSYLKAGIPWADIPTDMGLLATLYKVAKENGIKTIFVGNSFRTEGTQPTAWTHGDSKQLKFIQNKFGKQKLKTFPVLSPFKLIYYGTIKRIKMVRPFNYMQYDKSSAKELLVKEYDWKDYGGHHHESAFTKFAIAYWLPKKFGIDKRKITYSAQVRSGLISRDNALNLLSQPSYNLDLMEGDKDYVLKKLGISQNEYDEIWNAPNKSIYDYPSYLPLFNKYIKFAMKIFKYILPFKPMMGYELKK